MCVLNLSVSWLWSLGHVQMLYSSSCILIGRQGRGEGQMILTLHGWHNDVIYFSSGYLYVYVWVFITVCVCVFKAWSVSSHLLQQFSTRVSCRHGSYLFAKWNSPLLHPEDKRNIQIILFFTLTSFVKPPWLIIIEFATTHVKSLPCVHQIRD